MTDHQERRNTDIEEMAHAYSELRDRTRALVAETEAQYAALGRVVADNERLREVLRDVLNHFTDPGHPGRPCLRTHWVTVEQVDRWREDAPYRAQPEGDAS